jgi:transcriptional regulator with XRE-family HTH domain
MFQITKQSMYCEARSLYFDGNMTQKEIASEVGISIRTLRNWIKEACWDRLRKNAYLAPAIMLDNFCSQLIDLQNKIAARPEGKRAVKTSEAQKQRILLNCIVNMQKYPMQTFSFLAVRLQPPSDMVFTTEEEEKEEQKEEIETALRGRYKVYEEQKAAKIISTPNNTWNEAQMIENELLDEGFDAEYDNKTYQEEAKIREGEKEEKAGDENEENEDAPYVPKRNIKMPHGAIWMQKGDVLDPETQEVRRMTPEEWDILLGMGIGRRDFGNWCIAMED